MAIILHDMNFPQKLPSLNGLRAISILLVIISHYVMYYFGVKHVPLDDTLVSFNLGHLGVNVFFVISGYLITSLLLREEEATGNVSLKNFYVRRTIRIFPAYYFVLFVYFVLQLSSIIVIPNSSWATAITYTKYFNWYKDPYTTHFWSLAVEEHFYLFWPLVFRFLPKQRTFIATSVVILVPLIRFVMGHRIFVWLNHMTFFERADAIMWGCLFAVYQKQILNYIQRNKYVVHLSMLAIILSMLTPSLTGKLANDLLYRLSTSLFGSYGTVVNVAIAFIMLASVYGRKNVWFKVLNSKTFDFVGKLSYSIYLWQQFFILGMIGIITDAPYSLIGLVIASLISYYFIELPFLKFKKRFEVNRIKPANKLPQKAHVA